MKRNWVVDISTEDNDPLIFGPYVRHTAEDLAARFNFHDFGSDYGFIHATAHPIDNPGIRAMLAEFGQ